MHRRGRCRVVRRIPVPDAAKRDLQQTLDAIVAGGVAFGVNVAVHHPAYRGFSAAAGVADLDSGALLTPAHRFRAGSMLKTAVAVATLQLVEHRKLSLDARLTDLLPPGASRSCRRGTNV